MKLKTSTSAVLLSFLGVFFLAGVTLTGFYIRASVDAQIIKQFEQIKQGIHESKKILDNIND